MTKSQSDYEAALAAIRESGLEHPDGPLLESFVEQFADHDRAAAYLLNLNTNTHMPDLRAFVEEWKRIIAIFMRNTVSEAPDKHVIDSVTKRDGGKCCITGTPGSFWDPLVIVPILPRIEPANVATRSCREILDAFLTPKLKDWLLSESAEGKLFDRVENHWLVRKSAATAFAQGYFQLSFGKGSEYYEVLKNWTGGPHFPSILDEVDDFRPATFANHPSSNIKIPSRSNLEILSHFATPARWMYVSRHIAAKRLRQCRTSPPSPFSSILTCLSQTSATIMRTIWLYVPGSIRIRTYRGLASVGARIFGVTDSPNVQQLPFGLYLKMVNLATRGESLVNEYAALELVRRYSDLPVPRALDLVSDSSDIYLLTTRIPGHKLGLCLDSMSDHDTTILVDDLRRHLAALREIPRPQAWKYAIANAAGGPCFDYRINAAQDDNVEAGFVGPFLNEHDFNETLRCGAVPEVVHHGGHRMVFTHGDVNMRNVLVDDDGKLSGVVDWENAGWFPEYWDYTKAFFVTRHNSRWLGIVEEVFGHFGNFQGELATERELWNYCF
ncbi:kinase-like domain-containing protein [Chaetomium fimeti]|uniref:Kinase-like domain-containing protein n=1 Tax=Chaetomium fimeti TaxID=1854472 RepID=A0AAE0H6M7_9PEZI|nr:kinase-like domain-containing protein [Chaetomium fimeti]